MPFTFSHPAAALPLQRFLGPWGRMSALAIGSMVPDVSYFLGITTTRVQTHALETLLTWSLPIGLILYVLFHALLRQTLTELLPVSVQARLPPPLPHRYGWRDGLAVAVSIVCGAATHLLWDGFTHDGTAIVQALPVLQTQFGALGPYPVYGFSVVQHVSSVIGLAVLGVLAVRWFVATPPVAQVAPALSSGARWRINLALTAVPLGAGLWLLGTRGWQADDLALFVFTVLPAFFWMLMALALARRVTRARA